jgi:hypothetical protein
MVCLQLILKIEMIAFRKCMGTLKGPIQLYFSITMCQL